MSMEMAISKCPSPLKGIGIPGLRARGDFKDQKIEEICEDLMQFQEDYRKLLRIKYLLWGSTAFFLELHIDKESHMS